MDREHDIPNGSSAEHTTETANQADFVSEVVVENEESFVDEQPLQTEETVQAVIEELPSSIQKQNFSKNESKKKKKKLSSSTKWFIALFSVFLAVAILMSVIVSALGALLVGGAAVTTILSAYLMGSTDAPIHDIIPSPDQSGGLENDQPSNDLPPYHYDEDSWYNSEDLNDENLSSYEKVCALCNPSVVAISTDVGSGSGVIWSSDGYIVTNHHVIDGASSITVMLSNNAEYPATLIGTNAENDLALLRINVTGLLAAQLGDSDTLRMGQPVVAIGNPLGVLSNTATEGIVSATSREITVEGQTMTLMQISAPINPGNSGGGCFDINGKLIGIVNAKTSAAGIEGLGFAIPVNTAKIIIGNMIASDTTSLQKGVGVTGCYQITKENYSDFSDINLVKQIEKLNGEPLYGIYIISDSMVDYVDPRGNTFANGDVLTKINGREVKTLTDVSAIVNKYSAGDALTITVLRLEQSGSVARPTYKLTEYSFEIRVIEMYK